MPLSTEDLEQVLGYLKAHPDSWLPTHIIDLAGRISNVEAELKLQRELMEERFDAMDKRFEAVDKRFDEQSRHMNRWMTAMTIVLALTGVAMTVTNVIG